jgi:ABC-2 type transport system ATP-binding protein
VQNAAEVETALAVLRAAGVKVEDLEIGRADLEDVFLEIMQQPDAPASGLAPLAQEVLA